MNMYRRILMPDLGNKDVLNRSGAKVLVTK